MPDYALGAHTASLGLTFYDGELLPPEYQGGAFGSYGSFQRSVQLPFAPDPAQVEADFEHGVLTVVLPKKGQQETARKSRFAVLNGFWWPTMSEIRLEFRV